MSTYEEGRLYKVRYEGADCVAFTDGPAGLGWFVTGVGWLRDSSVTNVRPLIVLDPEDGRVKSFLKFSDEYASGGLADALADFMHEQLAPPHIEREK